MIMTRADKYEMQVNNDIQKYTPHYGYTMIDLTKSTILQHKREIGVM